MTDLTRGELHELRDKNPSGKDGAAWKPELTKLLPDYPSGKLIRYPFFRPLIITGNKDHTDEGKPRPFMRAGSPIDEKSGVYFIWDAKTRKIYIGSSVGTSKQGNVRRTILRHFQSWDRKKKLSEYVTKFKGNAPMKLAGIPEYQRKGGVTMPRRASIYVCILPVENDDKKIRRQFGGSGFNAMAPRQLEAWFFERVCPSLQCAGNNQIYKIERDDPDRQFDDVPF